MSHVQIDGTGGPCLKPPRPTSPLLLSHLQPEPISSAPGVPWRRPGLDEASTVFFAPGAPLAASPWPSIQSLSLSRSSSLLYTHSAFEAFGEWALIRPSARRSLLYSQLIPSRARCAMATVLNGIREKKTATPTAVFGTQRAKHTQESRQGQRPHEQDRTV